MSKLFNEHCPLGNMPCQYCSDEVNKTVRPACDRFTKKPVIIRRKIPMGLYCNNHIIGQTGWISEMIACPLIEGNKVKASLIRKDPDELQWMKIKQGS